MTDLTVANTIAAQLGGTRAVGAMLGVKSFVGSADTLSFAFKAKAKDGINGISIKLMPSDTYRIEFIRVTNRRGLNPPERIVVDTADDIYCDNLIDVIEGRTGLALRLPRFAKA